MNSKQMVLLAACALLHASAYAGSHEGTSNPQVVVQNGQKGVVVRTIYGDDCITEPVLQDLISCSAMQRLARINQYGPDPYVRPQLSFAYTRYDHSIGVLVLLRRFNAPLHEQIAGLLHDVSHTVFSHVGDHVFSEQDRCQLRQPRNAYQDEIFVWYLEQTDIPEILARHGMCVTQVLPKGGECVRLEQPLPELCVDRLEYILYGALLEQRISQKEIKRILDALSFSEGKFVFANVEAARTVGMCSLYLTEQVFGAEWNAVLYRKTADLLQYALACGIVSAYDIHFGTDDQIWQRLSANTDEPVRALCADLKNLHWAAGTPEQHDVALQAKFRGVDPWVASSDHQVVRLSVCDAPYQREYDRVKKAMEVQRYIRYVHA